MKRYAYYPGCSLHSSAKDYDMSFRAVAELLGIELEEIPDWICCGTSPAHNTNHLLSVALPAQNMALAAQVESEIAVACASCYGRLRVTQQELSADPELRERVEGILEETFPDRVSVWHLLEIFDREVGAEGLRSSVKQNLQGLKVACYYGCLLTRPDAALFETRKEDPLIMDRLVEVMGGEPVKWSHKTECCSQSLSFSKPALLHKLGGDILGAARRAGAECVAVACPLCQANLDLRQREIERKRGETYRLPVFYITQLMGLCLGLEPKALGIGKLVVPAGDLLTRKGFHG